MRILFLLLVLFTVPLLTCSQVATNLKHNATSLYYNSLVDLTNFISSEISSKASFCIVDPVTDWDKAFNFSSNLGFLSSCMEKQEDVAQRLCTAAEIRLYLDNYLMRVSSGRAGNYLKPNRNCNLKSWASGCEPGWACSVGTTPKVDLKNSSQVPARNVDCQPCCAGFFCPRGLTCMIPCPLGSYCPSATFNGTTDLCEPYLYQKPAGQPNHTCGAANIWATLGISEEIFCPAGSYCPSNTQKRTCSDGHYCRTGSTDQTRCSKMISCKSNTESQNIHTYGVMFLTTLSALLLIIYSCSDQILTIRERRRAKSREKAARILRESEHARLRWHSALDSAKKYMKKSHSNLSEVHEEDVIVIDETILEVDEFLSPSLNPSNSDASQLSSQEPGSRSEETGESNTRRLSSEKTSHGFNGQTLENEDKNTRRRIPKGRNTNTKIFKYAYAEMEKEKHQERQNENLSFSRVVAATTNPVMQKRPLIEVYFKDLTLQLKGKHKYLLRHVTGKIIPGHIAAVMGPSGAGKTTFLSALAGKVHGCIGRGAILVNGEPESIHSYKKIIGFVPQDDIVHGNLTVEENLFFSANCRLSADLPKAEKVLIVERVIENLGLQEVRDSIVGTVEKRGISGGQRKRVNVGLEMVMEPSLLFLDEPTSGLDSSSSLLLLKALKREALVGVNICMVVHQPSYALFKMFDDLILLAKGGLMVYHGPIKKVEEYFGGFGINVPDRVNPPDYYIDVLEGIVEPSKESAVNYKELPVAWMLYNGHTVPEDMQSLAAALTTSTNSTSYHSIVAHEEGSVPGEQWQDMKCNVALQKDSMYQPFLRRKDLSNRRTPCKLLQYKYFLGRIIKQRLREARLQATDYLILLISAICVGSITNIGDADFGAFGYSYTIIAMSLLCQIAALRSYSLDKLQFRRERASGMSSLAHFLAKDTVDHFNTLIKPAVYLSMFYFFTNPRSTFLDNYIVLVCLVYCVTGMGYVLAILLNPGPAQLFSVLLPVCLTLIATQALNNNGLKTVANLCFPKWALEAFVIANARRYYGVWIITRCLALYKYKYSLHAWKLCILILILFGVVSRTIAFMALLTAQRK